ncbi:unnamed protein product [Rotaria sp. Silwood2]|nr:unnamed protein product [Rotaria sp. Silwood2]CAF3998111.1 unnamed protein product [Rotaria sp. Silwood2]CAF4378273.1 unnamed protein product [Rotaria sp. Silwood2]CAF4770997.1 unnamed protein product [Rotaria sp. Silwood2]
MICTLSHNDINDDPFSNKNILLNCVSHAQNDMDKFADLMIAYHRGIFDNRQIAVIHNFSNLGYTYYDIPLPESDPNVGRIRNALEIFNIDDLKYGG